MNKSLKIERTHSLNDLLNIINHLRDPKRGCDWDIKQTAKTLSSHIREEAYELVEAIESENNENTLSSTEVIEDKEEDDLEIPAFLRRQKN